MNQPDGYLNKAQRDKFYLHMYLSYWNDFITLKVFAEHYDLDEKEAELIITEGRKVNELLSKENN